MLSMTLSFEVSWVLGLNCIIVCFYALELFVCSWIYMSIKVTELNTTLPWNLISKIILHMVWPHPLNHYSFLELYMVTDILLYP